MAKGKKQEKLSVVEKKKEPKKVFGLDLEYSVMGLKVNLLKFIGLQKKI